MLGPFLCGRLAAASLLPKLRDHFAEFLGSASPAGLGILSPSTCVGLRYGCHKVYSGFSRHGAFGLRYFFSLHFTPPGCAAAFPSAPLLRLCRFSLSRLPLSLCVPAVLLYGSTGFSTCCPSATPSGLALGPDLPGADQLYPGILGYSAWRILTSISLLIPAFSLPGTPPALIMHASSLQQCSPTGHGSCHSPWASAVCFSPGHFRRRASRLVSYYALFKRVAASEPTS